MNVINKSTYVYYFVLYITLLFTWARQDFIPMLARVVFLALLFVPITKRVSLFFPCLVLFLTTSLLSFAGYTFMPTETIIYVLVSMIMAAVAYRKRKYNNYPFVLFFLLFALTVIVNLIYSGKTEKVSFSLLLLLFLPITILVKDREKIVDLIPKLFVISTVACALLTLLNQQLLIHESYDYDRLMSGSLNYTCCTFGIGFIFALREFIRPSNSRLSKYFYAFFMMVLISTIVLEASRGAVLGIVVSTMLIILNRNSKFLSKIIIIVLAVLFVIVMYNNQTLDLLLYRIQSDTGTGSGRTEIWTDKLALYGNSLTIPSFFCGIGFYNAWNLGGAGNTYMGCHNDFLAFYLEYGFFGIILFLSLLFYPFRLAKTNSIRYDIMPLFAYICVTCMTLEPFSMGYLPYYFFLLYIYLISNKKTV